MSDEPNTRWTAKDWVLIISAIFTGITSVIASVYAVRNHAVTTTVMDTQQVQGQKQDKVVADVKDTQKAFEKFRESHK